MYILVVKWDYNDADYITQELYSDNINKARQIKDIISKLVNIQCKNWEFAEKLSVEDIKSLKVIFETDSIEDIFWQIVPFESNSWCYAHTIKNVKILQEIE